MNEKNLAPKRRFKEFQNTDVWKQRKFKNFTKLSQGLQIAISERYLEPGNNREFYITNEFLNPKSDKRYYIENASKNVTSEENDILMTRTGNTGKVITDIKGAFHNNFFKIAYTSDETAKLFLYYLLNSNTIQNNILARAGTSTIPDLNHNDFYNIEVSVPKFDEQKKIGAFFKQLDDTVTLHQRMLEKIKAEKSAFLSDMFPAEGEQVPKRRFSGFTDEWEEIKLGELGYTFSGLSGKSKKDFGHGDAEYVTYMNVFKNVISNCMLTERIDLDNKQTELKYGDVLFTTSSETPHEVGMSSVWLDKKPNVYLNSFCFGLRLTLSIDNSFMAYLLRSNEVRKQIKILAQGISRYNISKVKMLEININLPQYKEQQAIGEFFKKLDDKITNQQQKLDKLKAMKQAYLEEMFV